MDVFLNWLSILAVVGTLWVVIATVHDRIDQHREEKAWRKFMKGEWHDDK